MSKFFQDTDESETETESEEEIVQKPTSKLVLFHVN